MTGQRQPLTRITSYNVCYTKLLRVNELSDFIAGFEAEKVNNQVNGFFGYTAYNSIQHFEKIDINNQALPEEKIPDLLYSFYRYIISRNNFV